MTTEERGPDLSRNLTELVLGVAGVTVVYPATSAATQIREQAVRTVLGPREAVGRVALRQEEGALMVAVSIGVSDEFPAADVCRRVHAVIVDELSAALAGTPLVVRVAVSSIG